MAQKVGKNRVVDPDTGDPRPKARRTLTIC